MRANAPGEFCLMIVEDNEQARTLIKNTQNAHQDDRLIANMTDEERRYFPLRRIKEDPLFQEKRVSSVLQVADFCAYVLKKLFMGDKTYGTRFSGPILPLVSREAPKALKRKTS